MQKPMQYFKKDKNNIIKFILKRFQNNKTIAEKSV